MKDSNVSEVIDSSLVTSSIGAAWPPAPTNSNRMRGVFAGGVVRTTEDVDRYVDMFNSYRQAAADSGYDRLSIRAVMSLGSVALLRDDVMTVEGGFAFPSERRDFM